MFIQRYLRAASRIRMFPKHMIARIVLGLLLALIGLSYASDPSGVISRFSVYGPGAPSLVAALYVISGILMIVFCRWDMSVYAMLPHFLYMGMILQLAINDQASWSGFWAQSGISLLAAIAIMRGNQRLVPPFTHAEEGQG